MKLTQYRLVFAAVGLVGVLLIASPAIAAIIHFPSGEQFSEIYLLGPNQMASNMPFNIASGKNYVVYLGVGNHMDSPVYYACDVKLRNQTDSFPDETNQTPSALPTLYEFRAFVQSGANWTVPLTFSVAKVSASNNQSSIASLTINNVTFNVDKTAQFDQKNNGYYYQLLIELWALNPQSQSFEYQNRFVYLWMNITSTH